METDLDVGIFKPVKDDYSITMLERIFGPMVRSIADGTSLGGNGETVSMLSQLIAIFNIAILFVAVIILSYSIYVAIMDTASDGKLMGQNVSAGKTVLRTAFGVILLLPVSGGFTIVQVIVFYVLVWGSGLADTAWSRVADNSFAGVGYTSASSRLGSGIGSVSPMVAKQFGSAFQARTAGYICAHYSNKMSAVLGRTADISPVNARELDRYRAWYDFDPLDHKAFAWYFESPSGNYNNALNICGAVRAKFNDKSFAVESGLSFAKTDENDFTDVFNRMVTRAAITAQISSLNSLDAAAKELSAAIISQGTARDEVKIKELISKATADGINEYQKSFFDAMKASSGVNDYSKSLLAASKKNGWVFAATWQRLMASIYYKVHTKFDSAEFDISVPRNRAGFFGSSWGSGSSEASVFFREYSELMLYFDSLASTFIAAAENNDPQIIGQQETRSGWSLMNYLAEGIANTFLRADKASNAWSDPLIEVQTAGTYIMSTAIGIKAATTSASFIPIPAVAVAGNLLDALITPIFYALLAIGAILGVGIPFLPVLYFVGAVIGWIILSLEAVISIPLSVLLMFSPNRDGSIIGQNHNVLITLIGILFRPLLIVTGLVCAYIVMRVGLDLINDYFGNLITMMAPDGSITSVYVFVGALVFYALLVISTCLHASTLITALPDYVLGWIGTGLNTLAKSNPVEGAVNALTPAGAGLSIGGLSHGYSGTSRQIGNAYTNYKGAKNIGPKPPPASLK